ncbi:MAG: MFS transporter [Steroidobacteraceae bacterium]
MTQDRPPATRSQWQLLASRRFAPLFLTQVAGAFNDNIFRNALIILVSFQFANTDPARASLLANLAQGLFILPFFLFSALAGQLADKYDKAMLIRRIKLIEIVIMTLAGWFFVRGNYVGLLVLIFCNGLQSTLFGPLKYAILPTQLAETELVGANALIDAGTFLAILLGTLAGGILVGTLAGSAYWMMATLVVLALLGYLASRAILPGVAADPSLELRFNPFTETWRVIGYARGNRSVFLSILGISWFWFFGSLLLAQLPAYTGGTLRGSESVATLLLASFAIGTGLGSLLCERMSGHKIEIGLVPLGSIGLTAFGMDLYFAQPFAAGGEVLSWREFLGASRGQRVIADCALIGLFGGLFIVPLYALILQRSAERLRARIIAANNVLNAAFMVAAAVLAVIWLGLGLSIPQLFLYAAILNAGVAIYIYTLVPEFLMRFLTWILVNTLYRIRLRGLESIPDNGPALLVCNHVSFMDALIIAGSVRRPVRFVMDHSIFSIPVLSFIFRTAKAIPIASARENADLLRDAYDRIDAELADGELVCIFPEGKLTRDGSIDEFRGGVERILERRPVPVVPLALRGLWGSFFSRRGGRAMARWPRRFWSRIELVAGEVVAAADVSAAHLQQIVTQLRGDWA